MKRAFSLKQKGEKGDPLKEELISYIGDVVVAPTLGRNGILEIMLGMYEIMTKALRKENKKLIRKFARK